MQTQDTQGSAREHPQRLAVDPATSFVAASLVIEAVGTAIKELEHTTTGRMWAYLCGATSMTLEQFLGLVEGLVQTGFVKRDGTHGLVWQHDQDERWERLQVSVARIEARLAATRN